MKRQEKISLLQRLLEGKVSKAELQQRLNPDPSSISAVLVTENAEKPKPDDLVTAQVSFEGKGAGQSKVMTYLELETLLERVGGTLFILPDNHRS